MGRERGISRWRKRGRKKVKRREERENGEEE